MAKARTLHKKWTENFARCPLVDRHKNEFCRDIAFQLFYGKMVDGSYPEEFPSDFNRFYNSSWSAEPSEVVDTCLAYLHFIGIRIRKEAVSTHLNSAPEDIHKLLKKTYFILRTLAHRAELNISNPYMDNYGDIDYLVRIETGQAQLSIFETDLQVYYGKLANVPEGYGSDPVVRQLFESIEDSNASFFITGKAGTGKSTFVHFFTQQTKKKVLLTAFTGIAAMNVGGVTLHSFFQFPFRPLLPGDEEIKIFGEYDQRRRVIAEIDTVIIDEVSMLRADLLEAIDYSLRKNGGNPELPFGGKQVLFIGDLFQLPPVSKDGDEMEQFLFADVFKSPYFFDSDAYRNLKPRFFEFTKSHRQGEDLAFVELLDKVRLCEVSDETLAELNKRYGASIDDEFAITLSTNNRIANDVNQIRLAELPTSKYQFMADMKGDFDDKDTTSRLLELKKDAQVIFTKNDSTGQRRWVNGTIGKVEFIAQDIIEVRLPSGEVYKVEKDSWENRGYKYDRAKGKVKSEVKGTFHQYPLKLAWAITIHKSQGLTFDNVIIDLGSGAFVNGQLYTALSRCRKLSGILLRKRIMKSDVIQDQRLLEFYLSCKNEGETSLT